MNYSRIFCFSFMYFHPSLIPTSDSGLWLSSGSPKLYIGSSGQISGKILGHLVIVPPVLSPRLTLSLSAPSPVSKLT